MLLIDACGDGAGVAVCAVETVLAVEMLPRGSGSAEIVAAVQKMLERSSCRLSELDAIGVVSGPGSFTGVRVGMAAAKGFSEAAQVPMIAISRLKVLAEAAGAESNHLVALDAGRGECYVRDAAGQEWVTGTEEILAVARGGEVVVAEDRVAARLSDGGTGTQVRLRPLHVEDALLPLLRLYRAGVATMILEDANYVRRESDIYKKHGPKELEQAS